MSCCSPYTLNKDENNNYVCVHGNTVIAYCTNQNSACCMSKDFCGHENKSVRSNVKPDGENDPGYPYYFNLCPCHADNNYTCNYFKNNQALYEDCNKCMTSPDGCHDTDMFSYSETTGCNMGISTKIKPWNGEHVVAGGGFYGLADGSACPYRSCDNPGIQQDPTPTGVGVGNLTQHWIGVGNYMNKYR